MANRTEINPWDKLNTVLYVDENCVIKYCHEEWYLLARIGELRTTLAATSN
jgi:hypothetical protein